METITGAESFWQLARQPVRRDALLAASFGWMLDSMDVMLYAMVLPAAQRDLHMSAATAGMVMTLTLVMAAIGGIGFGFVADRLGRTRALTLSILIYTICTGLCAFVQTVPQLAICRMLLGIGMGGEWASGAALVAETWPQQHRAKALALVQSAWAVGYALAAVLVAVIVPHFGWRGVFLAGLLPALLTIWIRRRVKEPAQWVPATNVSVMELFRGPLAKRTLVISSMNAASLFAWWGLFAWAPSFLATPIAKGGHGLDVLQTSGFTVVMQVGSFLGYTSFGYFADRFSRKWVYITFLFAAAAVVPLYAVVRSPLALLLLGPVVGYWGSGYFSGFSVIASEAFPTELRGRALGFGYNIGRFVSAAAPYTVGRIAQERGFSFGLIVTAGGFLLAGTLALFLRSDWTEQPTPRLQGE
jgi:MFS family permease